MAKDILEQVRSENLALLASKGYAVNPHLPLLDHSAGLRSVDAIAHRVNILHIFYAIQLEGEQSISFFQKMIGDKGWERHLTPKEAAFLRERRLSGQMAVNLSWYKESIYALLWCCSRADNLYNLEEIDLADYYASIPPEKDLAPFLTTLTLRPVTEIYKALDYFYNLHWVSRHTSGKAALSLLSKLLAKRVRTDLNESLIVSRRKSLEWILYQELAWDNVVLDT